jgi:hypothetical protein
MNKTEHLLVILSEECAELSKEVSKALRFGLDDFEPGQNLTNREKIVNEFNDLYAVFTMLVEQGVFNDRRLLSKDAIEKKKQKVLQYMKYSENAGTLI